MRCSNTAHATGAGDLSIDGDGRGGQFVWPAAIGAGVGTLLTIALSLAWPRYAEHDPFDAMPFALVGLALGAAALNAAILIGLLRREYRVAQLRRRDEQRFRDGIEAMADAFVLWDRDDRLALWNARYPDIFPKIRPHLRPGIAYREVLEIATREEWPERSPAEIAAIVAGRMRMRGRRERIHIVLADGRTISTTERRTADGGVVCLFQDVSAERQVAAQLEESNALFRDGIEAMHDGFVLIDAQERIVSWNQSFLRMAPGMTPILEPGLPVREAIRFALALRREQRQEADLDAEVQRRLETYRRGGTIEMIAAGAQRHLLVTARRTSTGGMLLIHRDVTEIRTAEATARESLVRLQAALEAEREANAQHRRFVSMASHEFRTPLAIIDSASQRIEATIAGDAAISKRLGRIRGSVARLTDIIDRTLSSSRLDDGRIVPVPERFDLAQLVGETAGREQRISPDFTIALSCEPPRLEIVADRGMIEQVCTNLLSNAIKYSGASRLVEVALSQESDHATITVRDHGLGVAEAEIGMLFTRYFRASTAMGISGTGIGLHLVKELVTLHGGEVGVESVLGQGSVFRVRLRLQPAADAVAA
jgi:PAS domain S-box-containing protein